MLSAIYVPACDLTRPSATLPVLENYNSNRYSQLSLKCALLTNASQSYISSIQLRLVSQGLLPAPSLTDPTVHSEEVLGFCDSGASKEYPATGK